MAEDIVDRLAKMPIAEWEEARQEILRLRSMVNGSAVTQSVTDCKEVVAGDVEDAMAHLHSEIVQLHAALETLEDEKRVLEARLEAAVTNTTGTVSDFVHNTVEAVENVAHAVSNKVSEWAGETESAFRAEAERIQSDLREQVKALQVEIEHVRERAEAKIVALEHDLSQARLAAVTGSTTCAESPQTISNLQKALAELQEKFDVNVAALNNLKATNTTAMTYISELKNTVEVVTNDREKLKTALENAKTDLQKALDDKQLVSRFTRFFK